MKRANPTSPPPAAPEGFGDKTGLPWFRTWRSVYLFVLGSCVLWLILLYALSVFYS